MSFNVDVVIFIGFLLIVLATGIFYGRNVNTIKQYALGDRNFNTPTLVSTLIATWISGSLFMLGISETYSKGLFFILINVIGNIITFFIVAFVFAPRMREFIGAISVASAMERLYGKEVRIITAISGIIGVAGYIAVQFKVNAVIFSYFFGLQETVILVVSAIVVTLYSAFGGIKAVTFTDVIQFIIFGTMIPGLALIIWGTLSDPNQVSNVLLYDTKFSYANLSYSTNDSFLECINTLVYIAVPWLTPAIFQRIAMAQNTAQIKSSFFIAGILCACVNLIISWLAILMLAVDPTLNPQSLLPYIIDHYSFFGLKGLIVAGITAMVMSTIDSFINSSSVLFANDICKDFNLNKKNVIKISRVFAVFIALLSLFLSLKYSNLVSLILVSASFYGPIVSIPLIMAILGFRSTKKSVLIGMGAAFNAVVIWRLFFMYTGVDSVIPGMLTNLLFFIGSHYLLKQPGGWVGIKDNSDIEYIKVQREKSKQKLASAIKNFNFFTFCNNNIPKFESTYTFFAVFCIIAVFSAMYSMPIEIRLKHNDIIEFIYHSVLIIATAFLTYPIWPPTFKNKSFISVFWILGLFYTLSFVGGLQVIISNFGQFQLMIFLLSMVVLAMMVRWQVALFLIITGIILSIQFFKWYSGVDNINSNFGSLQFKIMYVLLLVSSILVAFFKPKQEYLEATEEKAEHLKYEVKGLEKEVGFVKRELENVVQGLEFLENQFKDKEGKLKTKEIYLKDQLKLRNIEIAKLKDLKDEFIRNIPHETNTPMTGILTLSEVLYSCYDSLDEKIVKQSIKDIVNSSDRLKSFVSNIADLSKLSALTYELNKMKVDLSELARERPVLYKKVFADDAKQKFIFEVEDNIIVDCDEYYITQAIDSLISNAVKYGEGKPITISLARTEDNKAQFTITDEGIGIPKDELISIFHKFTVSSKTRTPAGGRGVGLALCEKVITVHGGRVEAKSDGKKGSSFSFVLPL